MVYGLLGPIARASGIVRDLRRAQPYSGYEDFQFGVPGEQEGDGYARLRILFAEAQQSVRIMEQAVAALQSGSVREPFQFRAGAALGWVEAPRGGAFHWVRLDENGKVARYRIVPPSFANWHGFHLVRGEIRVPGFSDHAFHVRFVRGGERPMRTRQSNKFYEPMGHQRDCARE